MKIIVNRKDETVCYVQLRDLVFLANRNIHVFRELSIQFINEGKTLEEFVRINNIKLIEYIGNCNEIIEFDDYVNNSIESISNVIVTKNLLYKADSVSNAIVRHQTDDLHDIIAFKKGELNYSIPLVCTDEFVLELGNVRVCSTILKNKFIIKVDGEVNIADLLEQIKENIINKLNLKADYEFKVVELNGNYLLSIVPAKKVKKNVFQLLKKRTDN